jgi:hypothetical protein
MVVPTLSALLAHPAFHFLGNTAPVFSAILQHKLDKELIFLFRLG